MKKTISKTIRNLHNSVFSFEGYDALLGKLAELEGGEDATVAAEAVELLGYVQDNMKKAYTYGRMLAEEANKLAGIRASSFEAVDYRNAATALDRSETIFNGEVSAAASAVNKIAAFLGMPKVFLGNSENDRDVGDFASELYGTLNKLRTAAAI